jgi:hypothetical protein
MTLGEFVLAELVADRSALGSSALAEPALGGLVFDG